ncbi:hypothetical protein LUZ60_000110 [Juncus effusus]|nr:hypothetical protein LUZ60_000110 [Juncus effusus]
MAFLMEGCMASQIICGLVDMASSSLKQRLLPQNIKPELDQLNSNLPRIREFVSIIERDEQIKGKNEALDAWLWQFRDAVETAEDVLDELEYWKLEDQIARTTHDHVSDFVFPHKRKHIDYLNFTVKDDTLKRLREAVRRLDRVIAGTELFHQIAIALSSSETPNWKLNITRETGYLITENIIFGRNKEKNMLTEWLTKYESNATCLSTFTIIGIGGMGKTTLAQVVYDNKRVRDYFDMVVWVCVLDRFNVTDITRKILEAVSPVIPFAQNIDSLQAILEEKVLSKRVLLVLDDVWNDNSKTCWEKLLTPFKCAKHGSKILLTTRMNSVAEMIAEVVEGENANLELKGIEEDEFLLLFNKHAFFGVNPKDFKELMFIGRQISRKLDGCPLAAKVLGGQLNSNLTFDYWDEILNKDIFNIDITMIGIMPILRLSYYHLPACLQACFRYCSIFPQNYIFQKNELIYMWMSSGLILHGNEKPEDVGRRYIDCLVNKSFFDLKMSTCYVMHDLLRNLACSVSLEECLRIEGNDQLCIPKTVRHLYASIERENIHIIQEISHLKYLRTIFIELNGQDLEEDHTTLLSEALKGLNSLRLLSVISDFSCKLPDAIGNLVHLRYVSMWLRIYGLELDWFPDSVYRLYHLRVLKFDVKSKRTNKEIGISGMSNLINMRYLVIPNDLRLKIPRIGKLTSLQGSFVFYVGEERGYTIVELAGLMEIKDLVIKNLENVNIPKEAKKVNLSGKTDLNTLSLRWSEDPTRDPHLDENLIDNLQPNFKLDELKIKGYNGIASPCWMIDLSPYNFTSIKLINCYRWKNLPSIGQLPFLKYLELRYMNSVKRIDNMLYGNDNRCAFPSLTRFDIHGMEELEDWIGIESGILFPKLDVLVIGECPNLRALPSLPYSLTELYLTYVGLTTVPTFHQCHSPSASSLGIQDASGSFHQKQTLHLQILNIKNCKNLTDIPSDWFAKLPLLKFVAIGNCPRLVSCGMSDELSLMMEDLRIGPSGELEVSLLNSISFLTSLKRLILQDCVNITSLPSAEVCARLPAMRLIDIKNCDNLQSLGGIESLFSLRDLIISGCKKLIEISFSINQAAFKISPSHIENLMLDHQSLLNLEQLKNLTYVKKLVLGCSFTPLPDQWFLQNRNTLENIDIHDASSLQFISSSFQSLEFLKRLMIFNAPLIVSLPDLPITLEEVHICGCHVALIEEYRNGMDFVWNISKKVIRILVTSCVHQPPYDAVLEFEFGTEW